MKVTSGNQNNNHIEGNNRKLDGRQRVDKKNAAPKRTRYEKQRRPISTAFMHFLNAPLGN